MFTKWKIIKQQQHKLHKFLYFLKWIHVVFWLVSLICRDRYWVELMIHPPVDFSSECRLSAYYLSKRRPDKKTNELQTWKSRMCRMKNVILHVPNAFERENKRNRDSFIHTKCMSGMNALVTCDWFNWCIYTSVFSDWVCTSEPNT